jgi:hypothetical protein
MPEKFQDPQANFSSEEKAVNTLDNLQSVNTKNAKNQQSSQSKAKSDKLFLVSLFLLTFLLAAQVLYRNPSLYSDKIAKRLPEKVEMLNYNVFAHPNEAGVLLISGSMKNNAEHAQPYPTLEVSLTDAQSNLLGFSRFSPKEYLSNTTTNTALLPTETPISIRLKIKDPGSAATQFKFSFK